MRTTAIDEEPSNTEESPLLPKAQRSNSQQGDAKDIVQNDDVVEEISPRKLDMDHDKWLDRNILRRSR
jgi:hypothetical protein